MITGFESFTLELTKQEQRLANELSKYLKRFKGVAHCINNDGLRNYFLLIHKETVSPARVRKYIQYIRINNLVPRLCGGRKGYYIALDKVEWIKYLESYRQRVKAMEFTLACMNV